jgi:hypothetical protein
MLEHVEHLKMHCIFHYHFNSCFTEMIKINPNESDRIHPYKCYQFIWQCNIPWCWVLAVDREFADILVWEPLAGWPDGGFGKIWGGCFGLGPPAAVLLCCRGTEPPGPAAETASNSRKLTSFNSCYLFSVVSRSVIHYTHISLSISKITILRIHHTKWYVAKSI